MSTPPYQVRHAACRSESDWCSPRKDRYLYLYEDERGAALMSRRLDRWLGLELRHLETFYAVARAESFSQAALKLGYTQSAVSHQIAALERIVGARLLDRPGGRRPVSLTEHGRLLLRHADRVLTTLSAAETEMHAFVEGEERLRVGVFQSVGVRIVPSVLKYFSARVPGAAIELVERTWEADLLSDVQAGALDLTFATLPLEEGPFEFVELLSDPLVLLVRADSELAKRKSALTLEELARIPLMTYQRCRRVTQLAEEMRSRGLQPELLHPSDDNNTLQAMVAAGMGAAFLPRLAIEPAYLGVSVAEVALPVAPRIVVLAWHRDRPLTPAGHRFVTISGRVCAGIGEVDGPAKLAAVSAGH
jgi:DNA-binding transcriptional LysR family regulator